MDRQRIAEDHIVARYLAGQLSAADAAAFETHYAEDPDIVRDMDRALRLKEGLAVLKERGELDSLISASGSTPRGWTPSWKPAFALAAGLAAVIVGVLLWVSQATVGPIAGTLPAFTEHAGQPLRVAFTQVLVRTRGSEGPIQVALPATRSAIELRIFPSSRPQDSGFHLMLGQLDAANAVAPLGDVRARASVEDGFVTAYLDSGKLSRGRYVIDLVPEHPSSPPAVADRFVIELQ